MLPAMKFTVSHFTFRPMIHFESILAKGVEYLVRLFLSACPLVPAPFVEKTLYSIALSLFFCQISVDHVYETISGLSAPFH